LEKPKSTDWAQKEENIIKNRFANAVPFNFNRVILQPMIGYENTYYNASLYQGYFYPYILAQGMNNKYKDRDTDELKYLMI
jgi:protein tyrosine phosphatase